MLRKRWMQKKAAVLRPKKQSKAHNLASDRSSTAMARMITLRSSDGEEFEVEEAVAMMWQTIKHMIEDDCAASAIPLPNVTSKILSQVIEYSKRHAVGEAAYDAACDAAAGAAAAAAAVVAAANAAAGKTAASAAVAAVAFGAAVAAAAADVAAAADKAVAAKADAVAAADAAVAAAKAVAAAEAAKAAAAAAYAKLKEYDAEFVKVDQVTLFDLIMAANYLNIEGLLDLTCQTVSDMIKGKTPEEIRKTFNIMDNFTAEEEEEVRRENPWAFERRSDAEGEPVGF